MLTKLHHSQLVCTLLNISKKFSKLQDLKPSNPLENGVRTLKILMNKYAPRTTILPQAGFLYLKINYYCQMAGSYACFSSRAGAW